METLSTEMRYADIGSDNKIVIAKICQVRKAKLGTCNSKQFDVHNLKDPDVKEEFTITIRNRYSALQDETVVIIDQFHQVVNDELKS